MNVHQKTILVAALTVVFLVVIGLGYERRIEQAAIVPITNGFFMSPADYTATQNANARRSDMAVSRLRQSQLTWLLLVAICGGGLTLVAHNQERTPASEQQRKTRVG